MKKVSVIVIIFIIMIQFVACSPNNKELPDNIRVRLSLDHNNDWGNEAINFVNINADEIVYIPKVVVLDTGANVKDDMVSSGYNVLDNSHDVYDSDNHGTLVIAKLLNLICYAEIIPIKITENEEIEHFNLLKGLEKAVILQPDIISLSIGTKMNYPDIADIINEAINKNIIVIAAAGNQYGDELLFPAQYDGVISVLARDINNMDCAYNNKSRTKRSYSAPGEHILVNNEYMSGSSIAVSYVTAIVSQMIAICGRGKLNEERVNQILSSASFYPTKYSYGLVQYDASISKSRAID